MPTLAELLTIPTAADVRSQMLTALAALGFPVTSWEPDGVANNIVEVTSQIVAAQAQVAYPIAAGGFLDTAAAIKTATGADDPTWITLLAENVYGVTPTPATTAEGTATLANATATPITFGIATLRLSNPDGYTYTSTAAVTVPASGTAPVTIRADQPGATGSCGVNALSPVSPVAGVSVTNPALVAVDGESNASIASRCRARLASLSPNGAAAAYDYFARVADDGAGALGITRTAVTSNGGTGGVTVYAQNAAGTLSSGEAADAATYLLTMCVPDAVTLTVTPAPVAPIVVTATVYGGAAVTSQDCLDAVSAYLVGLPLGGVTASNVAPLSGIIGALQDVPGVVAVTLAAPAADVPLWPLTDPYAAALDPTSAVTVVVV